MTEQRYEITKATRDKYKVFAVSEAEMKKFANVSVELFSYLKDAKKLDFKIFFRVDSELVEIITPKNFSPELVDLVIHSRNKEYTNLDICVERKDYAKFEHLIQHIRDKKIDRLIARDPHLDRKTIMTFADLSGASQMIVRGGINKTVAARAKEAATKLIDGLMDSHVAIGTLSRMILIDATLYDHSAAVSMMSGIIAKLLLEKPAEEAEKIARAGLYHDVGKTCVPGKLLNKPGRFTPEEFEVIKTHTILGFEELKRATAAGAPIEKDVALVALEHHEKFFGGGYPLNKKGRFEDNPANGIHEYARIVSIADVYSALLMKRVYKEAYDQAHSLAVMRNLAPTDYDPNIWGKFEASVSQSISYYTAMERATQRDKGRILMLDDTGHLQEVKNQKNKNAV